MNKELQKLLKQINDKKNEVKSLVNDGKLDKARAAKEELVELQNRFDLLYDLDEDEQDGIENKVKDGTAKQVGGDVKPDKKNIVKSFVNIVKAGFLHKEADEADIKVYKDALTSDTTAGSEGEVGIGVTIPEDIRTDIIELRRSSDNLEQYVNVEGVTTKTGTRNIEVDAESTPFDNVDEAADFPEMDEPEFLPIEYKVKKKGGILKMTAELLEDTASNIMAYINKWIAKKTKATRNAMILKVLNEMTKGKEVTVENLDSLKDIFNEQLDPAIADNAVVITNQSGFNYLDKLKDKDGNYILQKDPTQQTKGKMLFGEYPIIKLSKKTLASEKIMNTDGHTIDGYKHPIFCGDLKEAVTLFDRNVLTIDLNDKGAGLWDKDMTGIKVRDRFDVQPVDKGASHQGSDYRSYQRVIWQQGGESVLLLKAGENMTDEEKEKYRGGLIATCKTYCHIDYDDDIEILELMFDTTLDEMTELIPNFDRNNLTSRQKLLAFMSVKELYDNRDKYRSDTKTLSAAVSSMLLKEIYGGAAE